MLYQCFARIAVGAPLTPDGARLVLDGFHRSLGLGEDATHRDAYAALEDAAPKHKRNEPPRDRYERSLEAYVDELWDVDCAIGGVSEGGLDPDRGYLFVGVRVEDFSFAVRDEQPAAASRPRPLKKGDLSAGSDFSHELGPDGAKAFAHAAKMYQRAGKMIVRDAFERTARLPLARNAEAQWALVRWLVRA